MQPGVARHGTEEWKPRDWSVQHRSGFYEFNCKLNFGLNNCGITDIQKKLHV